MREPRDFSESLLLMLPSPRYKEGEPHLGKNRGMDLHETVEWEMIDMSRYRVDGPPKPHMTASILSDVRAIGPNQDLILHEVRAIVNLIAFRTHHRPFRKFSIHPVGHSTLFFHRRIHGS